MSERNTMTVMEIARMLGYDRLSPSEGHQRSETEEYQNRRLLALAIQDGLLDKPEQIETYRGYYARSNIDREELVRDVIAAKEASYGFGSTPPGEVAEVFGWTSAQHQQAELNAQQRRRILETQVPPEELPWGDPSWFRGIAQRFNIPAEIPERPHIVMADQGTGPEVGGNITPIAWADEGSAEQSSGPRVWVDPEQIEGMTRSEVENTIAHEMLHTLMPQGTGHGPAFMHAADERNIGMVGAPFGQMGLDEAAEHPYSYGAPQGGTVAVYPSQGARMNAGVASGNNPRSFTNAAYQLLAEPGDDDLIEWERYLPLNNGNVAYLLPGSALLRSWTKFDRRPEYWEIGTVRPDGTVRWDCLTYTKPSRQVLHEYAIDGYCPPELREHEIQPTEEERRRLIRAADRIDIAYAGTPYQKWTERMVDAAVRDDTLTYEERAELIRWITRLSTTELEQAAEKGPRSLAHFTRQFNAVRDELVQSREQDPVAGARRERVFAAPDRKQMVGEGAPLLLPIAYDQPLDDAGDRMDTVREVIAEYQSLRAAMPSTSVTTQPRASLAWRPAQPRTRGRGSMRY